MAHVVVSEFMNEDALAPLQERYSVLFDPTLVDDRPRLLHEVAEAEGIIVRNRTQVEVGLIPQLRYVVAEQVDESWQAVGAIEPPPDQQGE